MKSVIVLLGLFVSIESFAQKNQAAHEASVTKNTPEAAQVNSRKSAPNFTLKSAGAKSSDVSLSDFKGKIVVLEWPNHGCPFVRKHYDSGNMQALQKSAVDKNVIWLSVVSSAPGKQGFVDATQAANDVVEYKSAATTVLLDPTGVVGKAYQAKTTPHMVVIDKDQRIAYQGAIDDKPDTDKNSIQGAKNYVSEAITELVANKPVSKDKTPAYGCGVKYL